MKNCALILFFMLALTGTAAAKMISVSSYIANIHSTPVLYEHNVVLQAPRYYPLSVRGKSNDFYEVVDYQGRRGWIHRTVVSNSPTVIIKTNRANIRKGPGTNYPIKFRGQLGVTFRVLETKGDWIHIKHESGNTGWIFGNLTWGAR